MQNIQKQLRKFQLPSAFTRLLTLYSVIIVIVNLFIIHKDSYHVPTPHLDCPCVKEHGKKIGVNFYHQQ